MLGHAEMSIPSQRMLPAKHGTWLWSSKSSALSPLNTQLRILLSKFPTSRNSCWKKQVLATCYEHVMFILLAVILSAISNLITSLMNWGVEWKLGVGKKGSISWIDFLINYDFNFLSLQHLQGLERCSVYCKHAGGQQDFNTSISCDVMRLTVSRPWILPHTAPNVSLLHLSVLRRVSFFPSHFCTRFVHVPSVVSLQPTYS